MEDEEENNNGDPVLIDFDNDGVDVGEETGGDLQNPNITAQDQYDEVQGSSTKKSTIVTDSNEFEAKVEKNEIKELIGEYEQLKIDETNLTGNKYNSRKSILAEMSSEINDKTIALLAVKNPDFLDVNDGVVTDKEGRVVETKEDFIKATGFTTGDIIYDQTSRQFKGDDFKNLELSVEQANDAWHYIKSSYKTETGNFITDLWMGESETLDFGQYEEQIKIEVLNQLDGSRVGDQLQKEGKDVKIGVFEGKTGNHISDWEAEVRDANSEYADDYGESVGGMTDKEVNDKYGWEHKAHNCCKGGK